jgi:hypothetical protein
MNGYSRLRYHWDGTKFHSGLPGEYEKQFEDLLQKARARNRGGEVEKPEFDEWPTVGEPFTWRPDDPARRRQKLDSRASPGAWIRASVFWLLLLAGAGIASALFTPEAASFVVGKLGTGDGSYMADRIRSRL